MIDLIDCFSYAYLTKYRKNNKSGDDVRWPKRFYLKLIFIIFVLIWLIHTRGSIIYSIMTNQTLDTKEKWVNIGVTLIDEKPPSLIRQQQYQDSIETEPMGIVSSEESNQVASQVANEFNQAQDMNLLNELFTEKMNGKRNQLSWPNLSVGYHLSEGTYKRALELSTYNYFTSKTITDEPFYTQFQDIPNAAYRLGENLYELNISARDVHIKTWHNLDILADYLVDVLGSQTLSENHKNMLSQYLWIYALPSNESEDGTPYIRIIVSLTFDAEE